LIKDCTNEDFSMKFQTLALAAVTTLATLGVGLAAKADTTTARCDVYPRGSDTATSSDTCTFSQRQGYVTITLKNGTVYDLTPSPTQAATYTDQNARPATREDALGTDGLIYRLADVSIFVYWDSSTVSSEPRRGEGNVPCSMGQPTYDRLCRATAIYGDPGNSTLTLVGPNGAEHVLNYYSNGLHSPDANDEVLVQLIGGEYFISINDTEFFRLDQTIVTGVD
jgi:hypothetical protein